MIIFCRYIGAVEIATVATSMLLCTKLQLLRHLHMRYQDSMLPVGKEITMQGLAAVECLCLLHKRTQQLVLITQRPTMSAITEQVVEI